MSGLSWKDWTGKESIWCAGCGDFGVLKAMQKTAASLGLDPDETVLVTGIGCSGNITAYFRSFGFHGIHGRALPAATGIKLANPELTVLVAGGDGDGFGIGLGHFLHAARRNVDLTYVVMDNQVYGLTKGQTSPTTPSDMSTKASPLGPMAEPLSPLELAVTGGATYVAQGFSGDQKQLVGLLEGAVRHEGFSLVNVQSPCVTYNHLNTYGFFREHTADLAAEGHDPSDRDAALAVARDRSRVPTGLLYRAEHSVFGDGRAGAYAVDAAADPAAHLGRGQAWADAFRVR